MKRYRTIVADPPWGEYGGGGRGAQQHYPLMKTHDIAALGVGVQRVAAQDCFLWLWATRMFLDDAIRDVIPAWGFEFVTMILWLKGEWIDRAARLVKLEQPGIGQYSRDAGVPEPLLLARRGSPKRIGQLDGPLVALRPRDPRKNQPIHSAKPPEAFTEIFEVVTPGPRLEMFCRTPRPGWDAWGNEVDSDVEITGGQAVLL